jgi:hypothetical protein
MMLTEKAWQEFIQAVVTTKEIEITCDDLLDRLGAYSGLTTAGIAPPEEFHLMEEHLAGCWESMEEYQALVTALAGS